MSKQNTHKEILSPSKTTSEVVVLNGSGFWASLNYTDLTSGAVKFYAGADPDYLNEVTDWQETADVSNNFDSFDYFTNAKYLKVEIVGVGSFSATLRITIL